MKSVMKKLLSLALSVAMVLTMVPAVRLQADAEAEAEAETPCAVDFCTGVYVNGICSKYPTHYQKATGTGKKTDPYQIGNAGQLFYYAARALDLNNSFGELTADIVLNENLLNADGTLNGNPEDFLVWKPIGTKEKPFYCSFYGNGHTISGLYISSTDQYVGLFGYTNNSQDYIENLRILDSYVEGDRFVGLISGYSYYGNFRGCFTANSVVKGDMYVGGISSYIGERTQNCYNAATVIGNQYVGGISYSGSMYPTENCLNLGTVTGNREVYAVNSMGSYIKNCYYLDTCGAEGTGRGKDLPVTAAQLASGEVAYLLGSAWGQNLDNGKEKQSHPVPGGAPVYPVLGCDNVNGSSYTNTEGQQEGGHTGDYGTNGICPRCDVYEPAELKDGYYQIKNAGNFYWFADQVNNGGEAGRTLNAILLNDIDLEGKPDGSGRKWTPIGTSGGTSSQSFRGIFDGNGKTITGLYVDAQRNALGLFGEVRDGVVRDFTIYGDVKLVGRHDYIGGVIGSACGTANEKGSVISGITSYVNVTLGEGSHGSNRVAGLIGYVNHTTLVENCVWYGTVDLDIYRAQDGVGGLVGKANAQFLGTIRNCAAYGTIRTAYLSGSYVNPSDNVPFTNIFIGGIVSNSLSQAVTNLENCVWGGTFIDETDLGSNANLTAVGTMNGRGTIANCYVLDNAPYITTYHAQDSYFTQITRQQLMGGEIAYLLSNTETGSTWGQVIDGESLPLPVGEKVYYGYLSCTATGKEYTNDPTVDDDKDKHTQAPVYLDQGDGTHTQRYNCCGTEFTSIRHSFTNSYCICGIYGGHWGDNCYWTLQDTLLQVYGTGTMRTSDWSLNQQYPWWKHRDEITAIVVHEGITHIAERAFESSGALTSVTLPKSLLTMGYSVFAVCGSLESVQLPENLKYIPETAFSSSGLKRIAIPQGIEYIGSSAFANNNALSEVILPEGLQRIDGNAFGWSLSLTRMDIPASVTSIANGAFTGSPTKLNVAAGNLNYCSDADGVLYSKDKTVLYHCPVEADEYTVAATVTEIASTAFISNRSNHIILPEGLHTIGSQAFMYANITYINIPISVQAIAGNAFHSCGSLKNTDVACTWNDEAPLYAFESYVTVSKVLHTGFDAETQLCLLCNAPHPDSAAVVSKNGVNVAAYTALADAFAAASGAAEADNLQVILLKHSDLSSSVAAPASGTFILDLNGFTANVEAQKLTVIDSSTTETTIGTGRLVTNATVTPDHTVNDIRYIALLREGMYTFHRLSFKVSTISLRTSAAGLYYTATLVCDYVLRDSISSYGVALSTKRMPGADFATAEDVLYTYYEDTPWTGTKITSCAVLDIFRQDADDNAERGKMKIYANAYLELYDGTLILAHDNKKEWIGGSLYDVLAVLDAKFTELDAATQALLYDFAQQWRDVITVYGFDNLPAEHIS